MRSSLRHPLQLSVSQEKTPGAVEGLVKYMQGFRAPGRPLSSYKLAFVKLNENPKQVLYLDKGESPGTLTGYCL